jgi:hypothetical protein
VGAVSGAEPGAVSGVVVVAVAMPSMFKEIRDCVKT